jgi:hypothetical protein
MWNTHWDDPFRLSQNRGVGLVSQGSLEWADYRVDATVTPHLAAAAGVAARVRGQRRWYALQLVPGGARLVRANDDQTTLAEASMAWEPFEAHQLALEVVADRITAWVDGRAMFEVRDDALPSGGIGLVCEVGTMVVDRVAVSARSR